MKTLLITREDPPQKGGISTYMSQLMRYLPSSEIQVVAPPIKNNFEFDSLQDYKIFRKKLLYKRFAFRWIKAIIAVFPIIRREKTDHIIRTHGFTKKELGGVFFNIY